MDKPGLQIRAAVIEEDRCTKLDSEQAIQAVIDGKQMIWVDIRWSDENAVREILTEKLDMHPLAVEDAVTSHERPALQEFGNTLFLSILVPTKKGDEVEPEELSFFLREKSLITVSQFDLNLVDDWFGRWEDHPNRLGGHPAYLMHSLMDAAVDSYFPVIDEVEDRIDEVTEEIFNGDSTKLPTIMRMKRQLLMIRRAVTPTRDVLNSLLRRDMNQVPDETKIYFQDVYDHTLRLTELIDSNRDALTSVLDVHLSTVSNNLNVVVKKMTVVSTVLMTMALIAGVYGMNFDHMPELHWVDGYPFALGLMFLSGLVIVGIFKVVKWL